MMHVAIIGNGIAGVTAALHIRERSDCKISLISAETKHFFSRTALMYIYMGHLRFEDTKPYEDWFWQEKQIDLIHDYVERVDTQNNRLICASGAVIPYDTLLVASGSKPNFIGWKGQDLQGVQGLYSIQDLELMEENTRDVKQASIVGGGLIGIEMAEMLRSRDIAVVFLVRESSFWNTVLPPEESEMVNNHIRAHGVDLRLSTELKEIKGDERGRVTGVITNHGEYIPCQFVGITIGVHPNIGFLKGSGIETNRGVLVDKYLRTNVENVYAAGDCVEHRQPPPGRKAIEQVWYTGKLMGQAVAATICGTPTPYEPGIWFNSAKFFDIEYQVYGEVPAQIQPPLSSVYWQHPEDEKSIRVVYDDKSVIKGIQTMGIRYRHDLCEQWIREKTPVEEVLVHLPAANFDPEFYEAYEGGLLQVYNRQTGKQLRLATRRGAASFFGLIRRKS